MRTEYFIAMDTHCRTTDVCIKTGGGKLIRREHTQTTIPHLRAIIESVPKPRRVTFEESGIAGWLYRSLKPFADEIIVCDPRRNAYIAKDGDKDDAIDAQKLNDLYRSGHWPGPESEAACGASRLFSNLPGVDMRVRETSRSSDARRRHCTDEDQRTSRGNQKAPRSSKK